MDITVEHDTGLHFVASTRGHRVESDQPQAMGGSDRGMTPPELLLASLGTCAGYYAAEYLRVRKLSLDGLSVRVTAEKASQPARLSAFCIEVDAPGARDERQKEGLVSTVKKCLIHNTLLNPPEITVGLSTLSGRNSDTVETSRGNEQRT
jgi:uncharacterized OsmC-like protein